MSIDFAKFLDFILKIPIFLHLGVNYDQLKQKYCKFVVRFDGQTEIFTDKDGIPRLRVYAARGECVNP